MCTDLDRARVWCLKRRRESGVLKENLIAGVGLAYIQSNFKDSLSLVYSK